ncbi:MAG: K+-transporting ATPase, subunit, partial [Polaromonas sp.]|nr:K+-transporting ATPase, subunit [Polaromonas sp.]
MNTTIKKPFGLMDAALLKPAIWASFVKLDPRVQWRNPVMLVVYIGSILTTLLGLQALQ